MAAWLRFDPADSGIYLKVQPVSEAFRVIGDPVTPSCGIDLPPRTRASALVVWLSDPEVQRHFGCITRGIAHRKTRGKVRIIYSGSAINSLIELGVSALALDI